MFNLLPYNEVNEQFSNENGNPGFLLSVSLFKMHQKNVLVHALFGDPLERLLGSGASGRAGLQRLAAAELQHAPELRVVLILLTRSRHIVGRRRQACVECGIAEASGVGRSPRGAA